MASPVLRPATLDDAPLAADLMTAAYPELAQDPVILRYRWDHPRHGYSHGRFIAELDGQPVAYTAWIHGPWERLPDRHCEIEVYLDQAAMDSSLLRQLLRWIEDRAVAEEARTLLATCAEDETEMLEALAALGFAKDRVEKVSELDLKVHGARLRDEAAAAKEQTLAHGVRMLTFSEWSDPDRWRKLYDLDAATRLDIPTTLPILTESFEDFESRYHAPDRPLDRLWVAVDDGMPVAMTYLKFPPVRGPIWTGYTCCRADHRGQGLARAVKLQSLAQAIELGVPKVLTDNDSENSPMLRINAALGYQPRPGLVEHLKRVITRNDG